jgi:hypothetical protein
MSNEQDQMNIIQDYLYNLSCAKPASQKTMWEHVMLQFACAIVSHSYEKHTDKDIIEWAGDLTVEYFKYNREVNRETAVVEANARTHGIKVQP